VGAQKYFVPQGAGYPSYATAYGGLGRGAKCTKYD